jgi:hypothetical protein
MEPTGFQAIKAAIVTFTDLGRDALHVYAGLATLFLSALMLRKPLRSWWPWIIVLTVAAGAELLDLRDDSITIGNLRWGASAHDILNTLFWPTVILLLARRTALFNAARDRS